MLIQCTKKLADTMKISLCQVDDESRDPLYDWHAHLFIFDRKKGIILMNNLTRYSIILYPLKAEHFKKLNTIFLNAIKDTFLAEGLEETKINEYINKCSEITYAKTHDRSIIGQINDFLVHATWHIEEFLPFDGQYSVDLNQWLGHIPIYKFGFPNDLIKEVFNKA